MGKYRLGFAVALVVLILDQLAKWFVTGPLDLNQLGDQLLLLPIFNFTYTRNEGISLGLLNATNPVGRWMLVVLTSAIAVGVAVWIGREKNRIDKSRSGWCSAERSATSSIGCVSAMWSTLPTCTLATSVRFWYSMSAMRRLALPS